MKKPIYQYLRIKKAKLDYLGERYFRLSFDSDLVLQVCISSGIDRRRGKGNTIGVYLISRMTLLSNYIGTSYVEPITKRQFETQFDKVVKWLK